MASRPFGFSRDPFAPTLDPTDAFESQAFASARDQLLRELRHGARLVALIGAAGTGKSLLLKAIEKALADDGRRVRRLDRGDLFDAGAMGDVDMLLIDEADAIDDAALAKLAQKAADPAAPAVVLALTRRRLDHIALPVSPRSVTLDELTAGDARDFVIDRVRRAGGSPALFTPGALGAITYAAGGSPRLLRLLSSGAIFQASQDGAERVEMGHARRAIAMQRGGVVADPALETVAGPAAVVEAEAPLMPVGVSPRAERASPLPVAAEPAPPPPPPAPAPEQARIAPAAAASLLLTEPAPPVEAAPADAASIERRSIRKRHLAAGVAALVVAGGAVWLWGIERPAVAPAPPAPAPTVASAPAQPAPVAPPPVETAAVTAAPAPTPTPTPAPPVEAAPEPAVATAEAEAPPAPEPEPAPPPAPPRVVVRYAGGQPGAADAAGRIADLLRARGYDVAAVSAAPGRIRQASVRYAAGERAAGEAINSDFETVLRAYQPGAVSRAAPSAEGDAARGTIELWVPDSAAGASRPLRTDRPPS